MFVSLLTDRRAEKTDILPCNYTNMRGYVGDAIDNIRIGSRIWLLEDANNTSKIRGMVKAYAEESLKWLIDDGLAKEINIDVSQKCDRIELIVSICRHDGSFFNELFSV
jgi:phage gp46-like protein